MPLDWSPRARKDLRKLPQGDAGRVVGTMERCFETGHGDVKYLKDSNPRCFRLRAGEHRAIFCQKGETLLVLRVLHRRDAY